MLADNGMPPDIVPANFRRGARYAWTAILDAARDDERAALVESADLLFEFIDRVSQLFSDTYAAAGPAPAISEEERRARALLARACAGEEPSGDDLQLAERIGFELGAAYRPFVAANPAWSVQRHMELAGRLRARRLLAVCEGRRVAGLAGQAVRWPELDGRAVSAQGPRTRRAELNEAFDELRVVVDVAVREGRSGPVEADDHLGELLLRRSPRLATRLRTRVYERLDPELTRTLDALIEHDFDRGATAAALPVHRNTLTNRLARIRTLTGLDVDSADGRGLLWLAWLEQSSR
jgi:hypothetical protein